MKKLIFILFLFAIIYSCSKKESITTVSPPLVVKLSGCDSVRLGLVKSTKDELNTLYLNKDKIGGFADTIYWSSSEHDYYIDTVWFQYFSDGAQDDYGELGTGYVRAVRTF